MRKIKESGYSLEDGFGWVVFQDGTSLQACLELRKRGIPTYKKVMNTLDDGMTDGICGDINSPLFEKYGIDECQIIFYKEMRKLGIKIISN